MKRFFLYLSFCLCILLLSGCWDRVEVNDIAIITATAIDQTEDNLIKVTAQVFIPRALSGGGGMGSGGGDLTLIRTGIGTNMADAVSKLQMALPRTIFWGQCKVFIFGQGLSEKGIQQQLDYLVRHPEPRGRAYMFVSTADTEKVLQLMPPLERYSGEVLKELLDFNIGLQVTMKDLDVMLTNAAQSAVLPLIKIYPPSEGKMENETIPYLSGSAIFSKDKMIGTIGEYETRGIMWIKNMLKDSTITFKPKNEEGKISLNPVRSNIHLVPKITNGQWKMTVKVRAEGDVVQNETNLNIMDPKIINRLEKDFGENIKHRIEVALKSLQTELHTDVVDFATEFHKHYPKEWKKEKNHWHEKFPQVEVNIDVAAYIRRPGYTNAPSGVPEDEVKKK
ncbi:Ger(x)C family spore germination protein [Cytobacillus massiliigabonensis]|uniref:Ger(x)C family spore germination protein n=1 Tax=Cytobacillus massiliigabonensis TaxID=1871011 RepID=UPI000C84173B|nr:Ger(x)C family spore germination protein [Cytobacillus massiliigabonensis]